MKGPLVSIIMAVYNCEDYVKAAIQSVLNQTYPNWELLIVNDGSTDNTEMKLKSFDDERILFFKQENMGVSAARNVGLNKMVGEFICFLDADDILMPSSIQARLEIFNEDENTEFVDGAVEVFDSSTSKIIRTYNPVFNGNPFNELLKISEQCFFGPTWMIKIIEGKKYQFKEGLTHGEDLLFYLSICQSGIYTPTPIVTYKYRTGSQSAMSNLELLEKGYRSIYEELKVYDQVSSEQLKTFLVKINSIMWKSYISHGQFFKALRAIMR